jgi:hypothetical protein
MPPAGFEPTIPAIARPQAYALDHAASGIGIIIFYFLEVKFVRSSEQTVVARAPANSPAWLQL